MEKPFLLHMFTPTPNVSPFDVNMAYDAGYHAVTPYTNVSLDQVAALTQDCIFSRGPKGAKRSGIFIGGREIGMAADMLDAARKAMVPGFAVSVFADPSGAFTTAAAMVAKAEAALKKHHQTDLSNVNLVILGGTGPVGTAAAVLASGAGAKVRIVSHSSFDRARISAQMANARYGASTEAAEGKSAEQRIELIANAQVILATAKAGVQVLNAGELAAAKSLLVAADLNAVPPAGIEGLGMLDDAAPLKTAGSGRALGIGALAVGNVKYQNMRALFETMLKADNPVYLDFRDAFELARRQVAA